MKITVGNQIRALYVYWRTISLKKIRNRTLQIRNFPGTQKSLKRVRTDQRKFIRHRETLQKKASHIIYTHLWYVCITMHKSP